MWWHLQCTTNKQTEKIILVSDADPDQRFSRCFLVSMPAFPKMRKTVHNYSSKPLISLYYIQVCRCRNRRETSLLQAIRETKLTTRKFGRQQKWRVQNFRKGVAPLLKFKRPSSLLSLERNSYVYESVNFSVNNFQKFFKRGPKRKGSPKVSLMPLDSSRHVIARVMAMVRVLLHA